MKALLCFDFYLDPCIALPDVRRPFLLFFLVAFLQYSIPGREVMCTLYIPLACRPPPSFAMYRLAPCTNATRSLLSFSPPQQDDMPYERRDGDRCTQ